MLAFTWRAKSGLATPRYRSGGAGIDHYEHVCVLLFRVDRTDRARCVTRVACPRGRPRRRGAARRHRDRHTAIDRMAPPGRTTRPASRIATVRGWPCGNGSIPVVRARLCAVANHADDLDSHRSATGGAIARDGDRDHVHRHRRSGAVCEVSSELARGVPTRFALNTKRVNRRISEVKIAAPTGDPGRCLSRPDGCCRQNRPNDVRPTPRHDHSCCWPIPYPWPTQINRR